MCNQSFIMSDPIVEVKQGKLKGKVSKNDNKFQYYSFKGIPYAKPPTGTLRFCVPQAPEPWSEIRDATKDCTICAQFDRETKSVIGNEDCLYLNVYTPRLPSSESELLPVMVLLEGYGFVFARGTDSAYGPNHLIEKDVVVVSLNYRLGILGFLSLNHREAPGNMGLRDQVLALKWVQENIINFGGDPKNVTIFGVNAGGASVGYLLLAPRAKGLFHKAIAQSGSPLSHWANNTHIKELAYKIPIAHGETITKDEELLKYLKTLSTHELIAASMMVYETDEIRGGFHFGFVPTIKEFGDWEPFLKREPYQLLEEAKFTPVPYMTGFCTREGLFKVSQDKNIFEKFVKDKQFIKYFPFHVKDSEKENTELKLKSTYMESKNLFNDTDAYVIDFFSDVDFIGGVYVTAKLIAIHEICPVYFYEFAYEGNLDYIKKCYSIEREGKYHGDEGDDIVKSNKLRPLTNTDELIRNKMNTMWTNFAKFGNPTPQIDDVICTKWNPVTTNEMLCLNIDETMEMKQDVYPERMDIYEKFFSKKSLLLQKLFFFGMMRYMLYKFT